MHSIVGNGRPSYCTTSFDAYSLSNTIHYLILVSVLKVTNKVFELIGNTAVFSRVKQHSMHFLRISRSGGYVILIHNGCHCTLKTESKSGNKGCTNSTRGFSALGALDLVLMLVIDLVFVATGTLLL